MITVVVSINGSPIYARTAVNRGEVRIKTPGETPYRYEVDDGTIIEHKRDDGAIKLAKMMLDTIKEQK